MIKKSVLEVLLKQIRLQLIEASVLPINKIFFQKNLIWCLEKSSPCVAALATEQRGVLIGLLLRLLFDNFFCTTRSPHSRPVFFPSNLHIIFVDSFSQT